MSFFPSIPANYDSIFNAPDQEEPKETCCSFCGHAIDEVFDCAVWLNIGKNLSAAFHASCGAEEWAEALDLPEREEITEGEGKEIVPVACKNCGKPIEYLSYLKVPCIQWRHVSGHYGCNKIKLMHSETYAEPAEREVEK